MTEQSTPTEMSKPSSRLPAIIFAVALCSWMLFLAGLTQTSAPVVVNQRQVRRADLVVLAVLASPGEIRIKETLRGEAPESDVVEVSNLNLVSMEEETPYIVPLWRDGRIVKVSNPRDPDKGGPVIYPDSKDVRAQITDAMERGVIVE